MTNLFYYTGLIIWAAVALVIALYVLLLVGRFTRNVWARTYLGQWIDYRNFRDKVLITYTIGDAENAQRLITHKNFRNKIFQHKVHQLLRERIANKQTSQNA